MLEHDTKAYEKRFASFGWMTITIDGHNMADVVKAFVKAKTSANQPVAILARTHKGKYFGAKIEDQLHWHGKDIGVESEPVMNNLKEQIKNENIEFTTYAPEG